MPRIQTIRRAFISYSRQDREFVDVLASDLRNSGYEVWIDFEGLEPGTPDWEAEVRDAIQESFAVLLIASPSSRQSPYVRSELLLAEVEQLPVYALWAKGENWIDSIPMNLAHIQYQDFRGSPYADSLGALIKELSKFGASIPSHFIYESFYQKIVPGGRRPRASTWAGTRTGAGASKIEVYAKKALSGLIEIRFADVFDALANSI